MLKRVQDTTTSITSYLFLGVALLFSLIVHFHGEEGAGGGFQAGALMASAIILHDVIFAFLPGSSNKFYDENLEWSLDFISFTGVFMYFGCGLISLALGGEVFQYSALQVEGVISHEAATKIGILIVETGVFLVVTTSMIRVWRAFAAILFESSKKTSSQSPLRKPNP